MHYMPWYKTPSLRGSWGSHWTGPHHEHDPENISDDGYPDIWSHYHPLIGLYDSTDPDVVECHLLQMKLAGIEGVIADWYGISGAADYPEIHEATKALFEACKKFGMWFSVCFEDRTIQYMLEQNQLAPEDVTNHLAETFQWLQREWFNAPHYFRLNNRPLFLNFGPIYLRNPTIWSTAMEHLPVQPAFFALHHLWRETGADGGFTWIHHDPWEGTPTDQTIRARINEVFSYSSKIPDEIIPSAFPGYHDVYGPDTRHLEHRNGDTLRDTLKVAMEGPWPLVQLVTWNDYGEGTIIEPTHEFGYLFLEIIQEARRNELGQTFHFTPADLRLPARLLALRKQPGMDPILLEKISHKLALGLTQIAATEIAQLEEMAKGTCQFSGE